MKNNNDLSDNKMYSEKDINKVLSKIGGKMVKEAEIALENPLISDNAKIQIRSKIRKEIDKRVICPYGKKRKGLVFTGVMFILIAALFATFGILGWLLNDGYNFANLSSSVTIILWCLLTFSSLLIGLGCFYLYRKQCNTELWDRI